MQRAESEAKWLALHQDLGLPVHCFRLGGSMLQVQNIVLLVQTSTVGSSSIAGLVAYF